jgi:aspartyl-tRNA(Asn)/glutamyl-tRNA(Gln) amidotransferase subunit A
LFIFHSIQDYHTALQNGSTSCVEAVQFYLNKIDAASHLNAYTHVYADEALQKARELDQKRKSGLQ